ncbi:D-alanyl-D-alanine carboxypeptidase/D-alanyl-D-alanine endopeptidase [Thiolinea disciformis]|uniref:D-alanyl-D-alanine carboxypeptidase/D-alanyl-D-alanine endopeptidase n=1 Tax=Thiolinea disciformis TaxID=125614 RepID=UPI00037A4D6F|nr:D-alanyl-D-alanine carboxypeptidase/D-alanyl-D-alanine-endopeptidase [Thiolinea disciformis]
MFKTLYTLLLLGGILSWSSHSDANLLITAGVVQPSLPPAEQPVIRQQQTQDLPASIADYLKQKNVPADALRVFVQDVNADAPLLLHNADLVSSPASVMKLLTTWSAIKTLGPAWTWSTEAWARGEIHDGVLNGDLIIKGYGDPFLVYESFWQFVHDLRLKGLREIRGDIIIDNSFFDIPAIDPAAFDGQPERVYNAPPSAAMFNFQASRIVYNANPAAGKVDLAIFPAPRGVTVDNQLKLVEGDCSRGNARPIVSRTSSGTIIARGNYAISCASQSTTMVLSTPEELVYQAFADFWTQLGGTLTGSYKLDAVKSGDRRLHVHVSSPLAEQVRLINKWSNNVMTRQLLLTMGAKLFGGKATLDKGRAAVLYVLKQQGISTDGIIIDNGSGLSRAERVTARQLGQLLQVIWRDPYMPELLNSLPLLGQDGTLAGRFRHSELQGRGRFKTGTIDGVSGLAGYLLTRSGKRMQIVIIFNGSQSGAYGQAVQNMLLEWVFEQ